MTITRPEQDAFGAALLDHLDGRTGPDPVLEIGTGESVPALPASWFFRPHAEWDWWERDLLDTVTTGPVLDLGCGAGRAALWFQERGFEVTGVDLSPGAVEVCRRRGLADVRLGDLRDPPDDRSWGAVLLLCGNLGLAGTRAATRAHLARLARRAAPGAVLVGDSVAPDGSAEVRLRIRYRDLATPWWPQYNIPPEDMADLGAGTGWHLARHRRNGEDHGVSLRRLAGTTGLASLDTPPSPP